MKSRLVQFLSCIVLLTFITMAQDPPAVQPSASNASTLKVDPLKLDFGTLAVGTLSAPQVTTLTNTGKDVLRIVDITASGIDFQQSNQCGETIAAGASCQVQVTFKPAIPGQRLGVLSVMVSPGTPTYVALTGNGS